MSGNFGYAVARAYAGHTDTGGDTGATSTYVRASLHEVATALSGGGETAHVDADLGDAG